MQRDIKIYCPKCGYVPTGADLWQCLPLCGFAWNTFETCGVCPNCGKHWEDTACPCCSQWSPHQEWYHEFTGDADRVSIEIALPA